MCLNNLETTTSLQVHGKKLSCMKLVPGAKKVGTVDPVNHI